MKKPIPHLMLLLPFLWLFADYHWNNQQNQENAVSDYGIPFSNIPMCGTSNNFILSQGDTTQPLAPLFDNLGEFEFKVTAKNDKIQAFFNQGIRLVYGFNHAEAHRAFKESTRLDPYFVMGYWGQALALAPNINDPVPDAAREQEAFEAIKKAKELRLMTTPKERAFIEAMSHRFADSTSVNRDSLNKTYEEAMKKLVEQFPDDLEAKTLYGAAMMNTMPWDYYLEHQVPKPKTQKVVQLLESVMNQNPKHPGAHHYYIHIVEASKTPERAEKSADILGTLMRGSGHLVHMPSHIYVRIGRYKDAAQSNIDAIEADEDYIAQCQAQGIYPLGYYPHNIHFLWFASTMEGKSAAAINAAKKTAAKVPAQMASQFSFIEGYMAVPLQAHVRFGKWNEILTTPKPDPGLKLLTATWHYARSIAFTRKGLLDKAHDELKPIATMQEMVQQKMHPDSIANGVDSAATATNLNILIVAHHMAAAELAAAEGQHKDAIALLEEAVQKEELLPYNEPPVWHHPARQVLGAILLENHQAKEAAKVYEEDLSVNRKNGWSLFGLHQSLVKQNKKKEADAVWKQFKEAWAEADIKLTSSRL